MEISGDLSTDNDRPLAAAHDRQQPRPRVASEGCPPGARRQVHPSETKTTPSNLVDGRVMLSATSGELNVQETRGEQLARLRESVRGGTYDVSSKDIAEAVMTQAISKNVVAPPRATTP